LWRPLRLNFVVYKFWLLLRIELGTDDAPNSVGYSQLP
jgi:hypothetical protein